MHSIGRCNTLEAAQAERVLHMKQRPRIYYTEDQRLLMWERWRKGESLQQIAQLFGRIHSSIQRILSETGGIQPASRCRSRLALTLADREEISRGLVCGRSIRYISVKLERPALLKGIDLSNYPQAKLNEIARALNERPRKTLGYDSPAQRFQQSVATTG